MALKKTWEKTIAGFSGKLTVVDAYCKVSEINGDKNNITFTVEIKPTVDGNAVDSCRYSFVPEMSTNFIAQAYQHAKKQPEFVDAQDC